MNIVKKILYRCLPEDRPHLGDTVATVQRLIILLVATGVVLVPAYLGLRNTEYKYTIDNIDQAPSFVNPLTGETLTMIELLRRDAELQDVRREVAQKMGVTLQAKPVKRGC